MASEKENQRWYKMRLRLLHIAFKSWVNEADKIHDWMFSFPKKNREFFLSCSSYPLALDWAPFLRFRVKVIAQKKTWSMRVPVREREREEGRERMRDRLWLICCRFCFLFSRLSLPMHIIHPSPVPVGLFNQPTDARQGRLIPRRKAQRFIWILCSGLTIEQPTPVRFIYTFFRDFVVFGTCPQYAGLRMYGSQSFR